MTDIPDATPEDLKLDLEAWWEIALSDVEQAMIRLTAHHKREADKWKGAELVILREKRIATLEAALRDMVDLVGAWMNGPVMRHISWTHEPSALTKASELLYPDGWAFDDKKLRRALTQTKETPDD